MEKRKMEAYWQELMLGNYCLKEVDIDKLEFKDFAYVIENKHSNIVPVDIYDESYDVATDMVPYKELLSLVYTAYKYSPFGIETTSDSSDNLLLFLLNEDKNRFEKHKIRLQSSMIVSMSYYLMVLLDAVVDNKIPVDSYLEKFIECILRVTDHLNDAGIMAEYYDISHVVHFSLKDIDNENNNLYIEAHEKLKNQLNTTYSSTLGDFYDDATIECLVFCLKFILTVFLVNKRVKKSEVKRFVELLAEIKKSGKVDDVKEQSFDFKCAITFFYDLNERLIFTKYGILKAVEELEGQNKESDSARAFIKNTIFEPHFPYRELESVFDMQEKDKRETVIAPSAVSRMIKHMRW
jgi:hypothetical protein